MSRLLSTVARNQAVRLVDTSGVKLCRLILTLPLLLACTSCTAAGAAKTGSYVFDPLRPRQTYQGLKVEQLYQENFDLLGSKLSEVNDWSSLISDGKYVSDTGWFKIQIPSLSTGKITVIEGVRFWRLDNKPATVHVKFTEQGFWRAAVTATKLRDDLQGSNDMLHIIEDGERGLLSRLKPAEYRAERIDGPLGAMVQIIVPGRVPDADWPYSLVKVDYHPNHPNTIGINRCFVKDGYLYELALIVAQPPSLTAQGFSAYATEQMDIFTSGFEYSQGNKGNN